LLYQKQEKTRKKEKRNNLINFKMLS